MHIGDPGCLTRRVTERQEVLGVRVSQRVLVGIGQNLENKWAVVLCWNIWSGWTAVNTFGLRLFILHEHNLVWFTCFVSCGGSLQAVTLFQLLVTLSWAWAEGGHDPWTCSTQSPAPADQRAVQRMLSAVDLVSPSCFFSCRMSCWIIQYDIDCMAAFKTLEIIFFTLAKQAKLW